MQKYEQAEAIGHPSRVLADSNTTWIARGNVCVLCSASARQPECRQYNYFVTGFLAAWRQPGRLLFQLAHRKLQVLCMTSSVLLIWRCLGHNAVQ